MKYSVMILWATAPCSYTAGHRHFSETQCVHIQDVLSSSCDNTILGLRRSHFLIISRPPFRYANWSVIPPTSEYHSCKEGVPTRSHEMTDHLGVIPWLDIMQQNYSLSAIFQNADIHMHTQAYCSNLRLGQLRLDKVRSGKVRLG